MIFMDSCSGPFEPSENMYTSGGRRVSVFGGRDPEVSFNLYNYDVCRYMYAL